MNELVSIIIPTHNRKESVLRCLQALELQTYPQVLMEIIVVADGCVDHTAEALRERKTAMTLKVAEQEGMGAAVARNTGASLATGTILIFLDDDIEASPGLVTAHVKAHADEKNQVVIGYLPPIIYEKKGIFPSRLREWWETSFHAMRHKSHQYHFRNLTSGNFSIRKELFLNVGGFNTVFTCQEDYELGLRLMLRGAQFHFEEAAMGYHHEMTDLNKSLKRRYDEGKAAVLFYRHYPATVSSLSPLKRFRSQPPFFYKVLLFSLFHLPVLAKLYTVYAKACLTLMERLRRRRSWQRYLDKLMNYYYLKGISELTGTMKQFRKMLNTPPPGPDAAGVMLRIDLKNGLQVAEQEMDEIRPAYIDIYFGPQYIGKLVQPYGHERWRGVHLRPVLAKKFRREVLQAVALENLQRTNIPYKTMEPLTKAETYDYTGT